MKMSSIGLRKLIQREGKRLKAYRDSVGVWTIGVGHTSAAGAPKVTPGMTITDAECMNILRKDVVQYENYINDAVTEPMEQNEFDAFVSVCFNVGPKFKTSTAIRKFNEGDKKRAAAAILMWNKPTEIRERRKDEYRQFITPYPGVQSPSEEGDTSVEVDESREEDTSTGVGEEAKDIARDAARDNAPGIIAAFFSKAWFLLKRGWLKLTAGLLTMSGQDWLILAGVVLTLGILGWYGYKYWKARRAKLAK